MTLSRTILGALLLSPALVGCGGEESSADADTNDPIDNGASGGAPEGSLGSGTSTSSPGTGMTSNGGASGMPMTSMPMQPGGGNGGTNDPQPNDGGAAGDVQGGGGDGPMAQGGSGGAGACGLSIDAELSEAIQTVGIVTFSTEASITGARIEFGLDTNYGMTAPVDLAEPNYRTLLLGMKQTREYHFRVIVESDGEECSGSDQTIMTGSLPNSLPDLEVTNHLPEQLTGGFLMTGQYQAMGGANSPAYIIDSDGDFVWAVEVGDYVTGVRMSYDGKYMWINGTDNTTAGGANVHRVTMDGLTNEDLSDEFGQQDHSITVLPDESVIFYGHDATQCANIRQRFPDGTVQPIINSGDAHGAPGACHVNHIEYSPEDDTLIFSDDLHDNYTKVTRDGEVVWVLGGQTTDFDGDGSSWDRQHGLDVLAIDRVLYFNNGPMGGEDGAQAIELQLDLENMTATRVWTYQADPPLNNDVLGDVQRMPNGNTIVAFSARGVVHEVDADGNLVQEISWPLGGAFGYIIKRDTLYGPPPR